MKIKEFKKLYDQVKSYDEHVPGWQQLPEGVAKFLWEEKLKRYAKEASEKDE